MAGQEDQGTLDVRQTNEARALRQLLACGVMSRADLARELHVTRSTASSLVASLIRAGQVVEGEASDDDRSARTGRPAIQLRLNPDHALYLGADIGAGSVRLCAVDFVGKVRYMVEAEYASAKPSPEQVARTLAEMVTRYCEMLPAPESVIGLNIAIPGVVDLKGDILRAPPLDWRQVPFRDIVERHLGPMPICALVNDANAFAAYVRHQPEDDLFRDAVFLLLEEGVGGSIFSNDKMLEGPQGLAGEIGHMPISPVEAKNQIARPKTFEDLVGRAAIVNDYAALRGQPSTFSDYLSALAAHTPEAQHVLEQWAAHFGRGLAVLTCLLNPAVIVVGGRVSALFAQAPDLVEEALRRNLMFETPPPRLHLAAAGPEGPVIGAALMLHRAQFAKLVG